MNVKNHWKKSPGQRYNDFLVTKVKPIPELSCELIELTHIPSGAEIIHIENDDPENLFCLSFRTRPDNSTGVAHILEHTVLCGSKKYPVKDPFFAMTRRSLHTFMNALTGSDFTCYPAASQVPKDFYNLLEVYIDAVFHPKLHRYSFLQEGHRLEFEKPNDPSSPLEHKGIVFNEMKGALNSPGARLEEAVHHALFPNITYGNNSGGDPKDIPNLTYEMLINFHEKYYHPSHCLFFFYGNLPLENHLDFIAEHALKDVKKLDPIPPIPLQPRFSNRKILELTYPSLPEDGIKDQDYIAWGWVTCPILNQSEVLALLVLHIVLLGTDAAPLKQNLLRSGYCKQVSASFEDETSEIPFILVLKGCPSHSAEQLEKVLFNTLKEIAEQGVSPDQIEHAMHQLELGRSEITGSHTPFGLSLFMRSALLKQHNGPPEDGLMIHSLFNDLRQHFLEDPHYLSKLIYKYFLNNPHAVRISMSPDPELAAHEEKEEKRLLQKIQENLTEKQKEELVRQAEALASFQKQQEDEDLSVLPKVSLEDIPKASRDYPLREIRTDSWTVYHHSCFTNEIVYATLAFPLPEIAESDLSLLRFYTVLAPQLGSGNRNYVQQLDAILADTGGLSLQLALNTQGADPHICIPYYEIRGKALYRKASKLFQLMRDLALGADFSDHARIKEVLFKHYTLLHSQYTQSSLRYAGSVCNSGLSVPNYISDRWFGLEYYKELQKWIGNIDSQLPELIHRLILLQQRLLSHSQRALILSCSAEMCNEIIGNKLYGLEDIPRGPFLPWKENYSIPNIHSKAYLISSPVAYTNVSMSSLAYTDPAASHLSLAASLFENLVLHQKIREQGGAYGTGAVNHALGGFFSFYCYRDPNISSSLLAIRNSVDLIAKGEFDEEDLEEAKFEVIQALDAPLAPGHRADVSFSRMLEGRTPELRQQFRNRLLEATKDEVIESVRTFIKPKIASATTIAFAGSTLLEKEKAALAQHHLPNLPIEE